MLKPIDEDKINRGIELMFEGIGLEKDDVSGEVLVSIALLLSKLRNEYERKALQ